VLSSQEGEVLRVLDLESHEEADSFEGVESFVDVVAQEDILVALHLPLVGKSKILKETHEVKETAIDTPEYLNRRTHSN
jgi:hypothetical protein